MIEFSLKISVVQMKVGNHHYQLNHLYLLENNIFILVYKCFYFFQYIGDKRIKKKRPLPIPLCLTNHLRKAQMTIYEMIQYKKI